MNKKILPLLFLGMFLFSLVSVSAFELNPFAETKTHDLDIKEDFSDFLKQDFNLEYGVIKLSKTIFWIPTDKIAEYSLIKSEDRQDFLSTVEALRDAKILIQDQASDKKAFDYFFGMLGKPYPH